MHIDLIILFLESLPEAAQNLIMILLFGDQKERLKPGKSNILRFVAAITLMLLASWILHPLAPNLMVNVVYHSAAYIVIVGVVYGMKPGTAAFSVTTLLSFVSAIENSFIPFVITYDMGGLQNFLNNDRIIILCSIVVRVIQGVAIYLLYKYEDVVDVRKISKPARRIFIILNIIALAAQVSFAQLYSDHFGSLSIYFQIIYAVIMLSMTIGLNMLIFALMHITIGQVAAHGYARFLQIKVQSQNTIKEFEDDVKDTFDDIYSLLKEDRDVDGAISILELILDKKDNFAENNKNLMEVNKNEDEP